MQPVASLDIECASWDQFYLGAMRYPDGTHAVCRNEDELFDLVCAYRGDVWTWAGGRYDTIWLARRAAKRGVRATGQLGGGSIVSLKLGKATVRDGFRLFPTKLAKACKLAGMTKGETGLPCVCGKECGGYCSIGPGLSRAQHRHVEEYLVHDTDCAARTVETIAERFEAWGLVLKNTIGSTSWATMRDVYGVPRAPWEEKSGALRWRDYEAAHRAYHGGRTELYRRSAPVIERHDLHAAYPAALADTAVPVGDYTRQVGHAARAAFHKEKPGVYSVTVRVPEMHVPPLPVHADSRLLYCTGSFSGSWVLPELQAALDLGVEIQHFDESITWSAAERVCEPYMRHVWGLRERYLADDKDSPEAALLKYAANAPTGKLGMKPESECLELAPDLEDVLSCRPSPCFDGAMHATMQECCEHVHRKCRRWEALDLGVDGAPPLVYTRGVYQLSDCANVHMAAYLTGVTRVKLGKGWREAGAALCYGDTDSRYALPGAPLSNVGDALGQWGFDGLGLDYLARGPKAYRFADATATLKRKDVERLRRQGLPGELGDVVLSGDYNVRSKGVPLRDALTWDQWAGWSDELRQLADQGTPVPLEGGVWGVKGGARRGEIFVRRDMSRAAKNSLHFAGSRRVHSDGTTSPLDFDQYMQLVARGEL